MSSEFGTNIFGLLLLVPTVQPLRAQGDPVAPGLARSSDPIVCPGQARLYFHRSSLEMLMFMWSHPKPWLYTQTQFFGKWATKSQ